MAIDTASIQSRINGLLVLLHDDEIDDRAVVENAFVGTLGAMELLYGRGSTQAAALGDARKTILSNRLSYAIQMRMLAQTIKGMLQSTLQEVQAGLVTSLAEQAAGEVFGDLVALAKDAHQSGHKTVAAVLACAALEDSLKRKAANLGIDVSGKTLDQVVNALKAASFFKGPQSEMALGSLLGYQHRRLESCPIRRALPSFAA